MTLNSVMTTLANAVRDKYNFTDKLSIDAVAGIIGNFNDFGSGTIYPSVYQVDMDIKRESSYTTLTPKSDLSRIAIPCNPGFNPIGKKVAVYLVASAKEEVTISVGPNSTLSTNPTIKVSGDMKGYFAELLYTGSGNLSVDINNQKGKTVNVQEIRAWATN